MNRELYDALLDAGAAKEKAASAAETIPAPDQVATPYDLVAMEVSLLWKIAGLLLAQTGLIVAAIKLLGVAT